MEQEYLIDTNIVIYYLDGKIPEDHVEKLDEILKASFNISTITKIELLGWHLLEPPMQEMIESFLSNANIIYLNADLEKETIKLKQSHKMKIPDAVIGATAIHYDLTLVTRNEKDFKRIEGIKIYNPFEEN